jgi:hypothetical protein
MPVLLAAAALAFAFAFERSLACPVQIPPQPLRTLYKVSERVVVARVGDRQVLQTDEEAESASVRIPLHVTENVKGSPAGVVYLHRDEYVGKDAAEVAEEVTMMYNGRVVPQLKRGERFLFFLEPREGGGYEVNDGSYGIKQLSDDDLKVYLERLKELAEMTRQGKEDKHALVEWLVRCAEQPATRWEGAYELLESAQAVETTADEQGADEAEVQPEADAPAPAAQETAESAAAAAPQVQTEPQTPEAQAAAVASGAWEGGTVLSMRPPPDDLRYAPPDPELSLLLNAVQKQRLSDALIATDEPEEGDDELMQLVKDYGDARFPAFVLARLHRFEDDAPQEAELWLHALAGSLKNEQIGKLADSYSQDTTYYEDEEETEAATETDAAAEANDAAADEAATPDEAEETPADQEAQIARWAAATERATRKRSAMLKALLARIDLFFATGQLASNSRQ